MTTNQTEQMTSQMQAVIAFAQEFAETHSLHYITPEILLLGILPQGHTPANQTLETLHTTLDQIKMKIADSLSPLTYVRTENILLTPRSQQVLDLAYEEAKRQGHASIGVEHLLWALTQEISGLPARLLAKEGITFETVSDALGDFSDLTRVHQDAANRRTVNKEMTEIWQRLQSEAQNGLPHIPKWFQYPVRIIFALLFFVMIIISFSSEKITFGERIFLPAFMGAITLCVWRIGIPRKMRQLARTFQQWDNPAIVGTLCDMLTWSDSAVRKEARSGLTRLLPQIHTAELHQLYLSQSSLLTRMLTPTMAKRETEFVIAIVGVFERVGAIREKAVVRQLTETRDESPQMRQVREAAQNCLATLELLEQQKTQKQTLLRASESASTDTLLRASLTPSETKPDELLRPIEEQSTEEKLSS